MSSKTSVKVLSNTLSLYGKMIITTLVSLYLTRVVLAYLGTNDFGLYNLIGGVIALLSFLNSAMMVSVQRYLSVAIGENDIQKVHTVFSTSIYIHIFLTVFLVVLIELCSLFLFEGFLNIEPSKIPAAKIVYHLMAISTGLTILGVPYNAMINAKEDLWLFALIESICAVLKVGIIFIFQHAKTDALITYTLWILVITALNFLLKYLWCKIKYIECKKVFAKKCNLPLLKELLGFSGWNAFGTLAMVGRNQGVAFVLNIFWGTAVNAVYGIANQVNSQLIYFSTMMTTSVTPQIMKSYGEGNHVRMLSLSIFTCKLSFYLSAVFALPLLLELPFVLEVWLKEVPENTEIFCTLILYMFLIMQLYPGIGRAIQSSGKIRAYQVYTSIVLLLPVPLGLLLGKLGFESYTILYLMIASQIVQMFVAVFIARVRVGLDVMAFLWFVCKSIIVFVLVYGSGYYIHNSLIKSCNPVFTFFITISSVAILYSILYYLFVLNKEDKIRINNLVITLLKKFRLLK